MTLRSEEGAFSATNGAALSAASSDTPSTEEAISTAALNAFAANGFNGASMRVIANNAGTSLSNLYNYFSSKSDLLARVLLESNMDLLQSLQTRLAAATADDCARLVVAVRTYVLWSAHRQTAGIVALSEVRYLTGALRKQVVASRDETERIFIDTVRSGVASGEFDTPYPRAAARNIVLLCAAFATWYRPSGARTAEEIADEQARLALAMVEARDPHRAIFRVAP
ncbi:MAG: TetR/AcrR family transcriptional regulator [Dehalococcoidia bacterium]